MTIYTHNKGCLRQGEGKPEEVAVTNEESAKKTESDFEPELSFESTETFLASRGLPLTQFVNKAIAISCMDAGLVSVKTGRKEPGSQYNDEKKCVKVFDLYDSISCKGVGRLFYGSLTAQEASQIRGHLINFPCLFAVQVFPREVAPLLLSALKGYATFYGFEYVTNIKLTFTDHPKDRQLLDPFWWGKDNMSITATGLKRKE